MRRRWWLWTMGAGGLFTLAVVLAAVSGRGYLLRAQANEGEWVEETVCEPAAEDVAILNNPPEEEICEDQEVCETALSDEQVKKLGLNRVLSRSLRASWGYFDWFPWQELGGVHPETFGPPPGINPNPATCHLRRVCNLRPLPKPDTFGQRVCRTVLKWVPRTVSGCIFAGGTLTCPGHGSSGEVNYEQSCNNVGGTCRTGCTISEENRGRALCGGSFTTCCVPR